MISPDRIKAIMDNPYHEFKSDEVSDIARELMEAREEIATQMAVTENYAKFQERHHRKDMASIALALGLPESADAEQIVSKIRKMRDSLRRMHDETSVLRDGKRLNMGPMLEPSEAAVLEARAILESPEVK